MKFLKNMGQCLGALCCIATAMIGYTIHGSLFWAFIEVS